jgi:peroxiredoxin
MVARKLFFFLLLFIAIKASSQTNFTFSPEKPKPGDIITITYEPAGDIANTLKPVEASVFQNGKRGAISAEDLALVKNGKNYTATIQIDTGSSFIYFSFSADGKFDNNFNQGYWINIYENDKIRKSSYFLLSSFYQRSGTGVDMNYEKAFEAMEKEIALYPENKKLYLNSYFYLINQVKKDEAPALIQKEIETLLKAGLKDENDYYSIENLYTVAKLPEQGKIIAALRKEKFPNGKWKIIETINKYYEEKDLVKKKELYDMIEQKANTDKDWEYLKPNLDRYKSAMAFIYTEKKDWQGLKKATEDIKDKTILASIYNNAAWEMQKTNDNLVLAEEFSRFATEYVKSEWKNPTAKKPTNRTPKQWENDRAFYYGMYGDTYAMVMYRMGQYKKGYPYAKDAAFTVNKGKDADQNNTYALLAEKVLPAKQYKKEIEQFVKDGKGTSDMREILKTVYIKEKKSETGFDDYIAALQKENIQRMLAELKKSMLSETAPVFALNDIDGKKIDITDLKGKVVIIDFWATWCGPCKASFPGMQKMVNKYKDDPNVKFVFIDTWERGEDKKKDAGDFIKSNKYSFHVLMDNDNKVVEQFKVEGIPTKFVLDKNGIIRFKAVGFDGSDEKLINELTAMIDMATTAVGTEGKKTF